MKVNACTTTVHLCPYHGTSGYFVWALVRWGHRGCPKPQVLHRDPCWALPVLFGDLVSVRCELRLLMIHTGITMTGRVRGALLGNVLPMSGMCDICVSVCQWPAGVVFRCVKGRCFSLTTGAAMNGPDAESRTPVLGFLCRFRSSGTSIARVNDPFFSNERAILTFLFWVPAT